MEGDGMLCAQFHVDTRSDDPGPRCGHTLTCVPADGGGQRLIIFGGATALEGDGPSGSTSGIRLAGATSDVHSFDVRSGVWTKLDPTGEGPSPRAAHSAAAVGNMVVVQGGIGPSGLASEDLHVLDLQGAPRWHRVSVKGPGPGQRYAHVISFVAQRFLVVHGGNDGAKPLGDSWYLDTTSKPYEWFKMNPAGDVPPPRMYAAAAPRADGLLLLCGGRGADSSPLSDAFGLARHRDGRWEWAAAPGEAPTARYQHAVAFVGTRLLVSGGALGGGSMVDDHLSLSVLNTSAGSAAGWSVAEIERAGGSSAAAATASRRCRHATAGVGPLVFVCGGLRGGTLLGDMYVMEESPEAQGLTRAEATAVLAEHVDLAAPAWQRWLRDAGLLEEAAAFSAANPDAVVTHHDGSVKPGFATPTTTNLESLKFVGGSAGSLKFDHGSPGSADGSPENNIGANDEAMTKLSSEEAKAAVALAKAAHVNIDSPPESHGSGKSSVHTPSPQSTARGGARGRGTASTARKPPSSEVRLHHRAVVVAAGSHDGPASGLGSLVRQLSIDQFESESKRIGPDMAAFGTPMVKMGSLDPGSMTPDGRGVLTPDHEKPDTVPRKVLNELLHPRQWEPDPVGASRGFILNVDEIDELCTLAEEKFQAESTVLRLRAPTKIFGDLHGQYGDLMRLFAEYGSPSTAGDIAYIDYLFLGDYVDRGSYSLETMSLLLALKIEHPDNIHLLRGNHEEADINALFGFRTECIERLGEEAGVQAWTRFNNLFQWLPLAAVIEDRVACMHGGIGRSITHISQLEELERPLTIESGGIMLMDVLWSDPTESDRVEGLRPNARGPGLVTFGPDRVRKFCEDNDLQMIIRAHECVMDGFERFAGGLLITVFSATNYCGTANNAGAILVLGRDLKLYPKLIHPLPPSALYGDGGEDEDMEGGSWQLALNKDRPPTPPRGRPGDQKSRIGSGGDIF